jgi:hypothetical protein
MVECDNGLSWHTICFSFYPEKQIPEESKISRSERGGAHTREGNCSPVGTPAREIAVSRPDLILLPTIDLSIGKEPSALYIQRLPCVIGRSPHCDEVLDDLMISRRHCTLSLRDGRVWIEDLASRNGTRLNGQRLTVPQPLQDGDVLQFANLEFEVYFQKVDTRLDGDTQPPPTRAPGTARPSDSEALQASTS